MDAFPFASLFTPVIGLVRWWTRIEVELVTHNDTDTLPGVADARAKGAMFRWVSEDKVARRRQDGFEIFSHRSNFWRRAKSYKDRCGARLMVQRKSD